MTTVSESGKRVFEGISPHAFEHPLDRSALSTLQKVPGLDWIIRKFLSAIGERRLRLFVLASAVRVNERQFPRYKELYDEACNILDIDTPPELFVAQRFMVNAAAIGVDKPFIVLTSELLEIFDEGEVQCVMGHELGHVMSGHALYTTVLILLIKYWYLFVGIPGGIYAVIAIQLALLEWSRKAELTSDRAGLLVSQDLELSHRVDMKLAGGRRSDQMSVEEFEKQAEEYEAGGDLLDGVLKLVNLLGVTHPFPVLRVVELKRWVESGEFQKILDGAYERRGEKPQRSWADDIKATAGSYREGFDATRDPFLSTLRDLGGGAAATGGEILSFIKRTIGAGGNDDMDDDDKK